MANTLTLANTRIARLGDLYFALRCEVDDLFNNVESDIPHRIKPCPCLCGASVQPRRGAFPQILCGMIKVHAERADRIPSKALGIQIPKAPTAIAQPDDHLRSRDALSQSFKPQAGAQRVNIAQPRHQAAAFEVRDSFARAGGAATQARQDGDLNFALDGSPPRRVVLTPKRDHDPIRSNQERLSRDCFVQGLKRRRLSIG